jgi:hypothetical protein
MFIHAYILTGTLNNKNEEISDHVLSILLHTEWRSMILSIMAHGKRK